MNIFSKINLKGDRGIWVVMILLSMASILMVYSSAAGIGQPWNYLGKQTLGLIGGLFLAYILSHIPSSYFKGSAIIIFIISIVLMVLLLKFGVLRNGARRILCFFQPIEFVKIGLLIFTAKMLEIYQQKPKTIKSYLLVLVPIIGVCFLIFLSSFSSALILGVSCFIMMCVAGIRRKHLLATVLVAIGILLIGIGITVVTVKYTKALRDSGKKVEGITLTIEKALYKTRLPTVVSRSGLLKDDNQPTKNNQHLKKYEQADYARLAIASSGLIGKGVGKSTFRYYLPEAFSDFIFTITVEEWGILFTIVLILFYFLLFPWRVGVIIAKSNTYFPTFLVVGITLQITLQALVHMGVSTGFFPVTGQNLPLVSQGLSNVFSTCIMFGIVLSISREVRTKSQAQVESISIKNASNI
ncbi:rod shape-determining protein RodA [Bacteroidia bacterium]|nr:rod shape-determining protein RodA [Bacteroidia bacterium]